MLFLTTLNFMIAFCGSNYVIRDDEGQLDAIIEGNSTTETSTKNGNTSDSSEDDDSSSECDIIDSFLYWGIDPRRREKLESSLPSIVEEEGSNSESSEAQRAPLKDSHMLSTDCQSLITKAKPITEKTLAQQMYMRRKSMLFDRIIDSYTESKVMSFKEDRQMNKYYDEMHKKCNPHLYAD